MKRRDFLKVIGSSTITLAISGCTANFQRPSGKKPADKPNVILIYIDDPGTLDANCYGTDYLHTPNIDSLAKSGIRFTQAYAHTVCCPSRAGVLTGRYPQRAGVGDWCTNFPSDNNRGHPIEGMPIEEVTLADVLKKAGYRTALFGKWHLGGKEGYWPNDQGFDEFFGHLSGGIDAYTHKYVKGANAPHDLYRNGKEVFEDGKYFPDLLVRETNRFLEANRDNPFFLYLAFDMVHTPHQPDPEIEKRYEHLSQPHRKYRAYLSTLDDRIGRVLATLSKKGLLNNTMVIFQGDNGHANRMGGNAGKWRGAKGSLLEAGIRVPTIISFPHRIPEGQVRDQVITNMDFFPTILKMCNLTLPDRKIDGKDILPVLRSATASSPHKVLHWQWPIWGSDKQQWVVREGDWKLIVNGLDASGSKLESPFLAFLADDKPEYKNYADENPDVVDRLTKLHAEWDRAVNK